MKHDIKFRDLYARVTEGDEMANAIVSYMKHQWYESCGEQRYNHRLFIDLWIIRFRFDWETKTYDI